MEHVVLSVSFGSWFLCVSRITLTWRALLFVELTRELESESVDVARARA